MIKSPLKFKSFFDLKSSKAANSFWVKLLLYIDPERDSSCNTF
nr:MAG TPA: hypothetical protein [Caudoviricetes sp.]